MAIPQSPKPCILAIDASTGPCSVAVWREGRIRAYVENSKPVMQSASLMPMVEQALMESGIDYSDLTCVAATVGPGSFTGIRVGLASARGIAFAAGIASAGYTTLDILAYAARKSPRAQRVLAILNAGKGECYYQCHDSKPQVGLLEDALAAAGPAPVAVAGNVRVEAPGFTLCDTTFPRADILAEMAAQAAIASQSLRPFYIRPPDAKLPQQKLTPQKT